MKRLLFLILAAALTQARAAAEEAALPRTETRKVSLSLDGSFDRYGESLGEEFRAGLEVDCASALKLGQSAFDWSLELYYSYYRSETAGEASNANSAGLDLAKIMLTSWHGKELKTVQPYLLAGAELTWLKETDTAGEKTVSRFLSPTAGLGAELKLTRRASLKTESRTNFADGERRISGFTLGISYAFLGTEDED